MYTLARMMLMLAVIISIYGLIGLAAVVGTWGWICLVVMAAALFRKEARHWTAYGTARWANAEDDLPKARMVGAATGLIIGRMQERGTVGSKLRALMDKKITAKAACQRVFSKHGELIRLPDTVPHSLVCSPTGGGKGVSLIVPWLQTDPSSAVVVDNKGELARITQKARLRMKHRVVLLDPWKIVTQTPDTLNPIDGIDKDSPRAVDECNSLADALVIRTGQEKEPHWLDRAAAWIAATAATTVYYGQRDKGTRSLQIIAAMLSSPALLKAAVKLMLESPEVWGGSLARMGGQLSHSVGEELGSSLSTVSRFIRFLNTPAVAESTHTSSFDPMDLRKNKMTVYLILPAEYMNSHAALMRMWLVSLMGAVVRGGLQ